MTGTRARLSGAMRICHLSGTSVEGHYFRNMAHGLTKNGVSVMYGCLGEHEPPAWLTEVPGVGYFSVGASSRSQYPRAVVRLARILRASRTDVLQTHLFDAAIVGLLAGRLARVPLVIVTRHHLDQHQLLERPVHVELDRVTARMADRVIVPAAAVQGHMVAVEKLEPDRIEVIHLGLDLEAFAPRASAGRPVRDEFGLNGAFVVGCVGRLEPAKGLSSLLAAISVLRREISGLKLLVLGDHPDARNREAVVREIARLGLQDHVILAGHRGDVPACMQAMDVLAHPSQTEALPQVLIEAMAVGTPVVATSVGGVPEIVEPGKTGTLVPLSDPGALAAAISALYRDPALRGSYSEASIRRARARFDASRMVEHHLECYKRWLSEKRAGQSVEPTTARRSQ